MNFVDELIEKYREKYTQSITHPLTNELCNGTLPNYKLYTYLVQDLKFFQIGLNVLGKTIAYCDSSESAIVLGKQVGFLCNDENEYFARCLQELKDNHFDELQTHVGKLVADESITLDAVKLYNEFLQYLTYESTSYIELITFVYVMEQVYLGWANYNIDHNTVAANLPYKYNEWIVLHSGQDFTKWTNFLKLEVIRCVQTPEQKTLCEKYFVKALDHEIAFFSDCYNYNE
jgi:thiaminase